MTSLIFGLFIQVSDSGPHGPLVLSNQNSLLFCSIGTSGEGQHMVSWPIIYGSLNIENNIHLLHLALFLRN